MPELPEVETVRRALQRKRSGVLGRVVTAVELRRPEVLHRHDRRRAAQALLQSCRLIAMERHGKQLAIVGEMVSSRRAAVGERGMPAAVAGPVLCVHLGMTGTLRRGPGSIPPDAGAMHDRHVHVVWHFDDGSRLVFRDPRRFGGLWAFADMPTLRANRWAELGPDALLISARSLWARFADSRRPIKAALMDQQVLAGMGNIYVDESLFAAGLHPLRPAGQHTFAELQCLVRQARRILRQAIAAGGSSLRDYVNVNGQSGRYQNGHQVYGRAGKPCTHCGETLLSLRLSGRATVFCPKCQPDPRGPIQQVNR